jgi:protein-S-isoprenylcysteine O-methyltransferase Ste14
MLSETVLRIALVALIGIDLSLPRYFKHKYATRGRQAADGFAGALIPERLLTVALYSGLLAFAINPQWMAWSHVQLRVGLRAVGIPLSVAGLAGLGWAFRYLGHNLTAGLGARADRTLVTTGPYRWVRHPMYSAWTVLILGYCLLTANWCIALLLLATLAVVVHRTPAEEAMLAQRFGNAYLQYTEATGRFIPSHLWRPRKRGSR